MSKNLSKPAANAKLSNLSEEESKSAHSNPVAAQYVKKRKDKAEKQIEEEPAQQTKTTWDEWESYKYAIL